MESAAHGVAVFVEEYAAAHGIGCGAAGRAESRARYGGGADSADNADSACSADAHRSSADVACRSSIASAYSADAPCAHRSSAGCGRHCCARSLRALFVCGGGNNGGDGFAAARMLFLRGARASAVVLADRAAIGGDAAANLCICEKLGMDIAYAAGGGAAGIVAERLADADIVVDAIFGTGFRGAPSGACKAAIDAINASAKPVISIDAPSGLDGLSGSAPGSCVRASATVALGLVKTGLASGPDAGMAGRVVLRDIGIPARAAERMEWDTRLITAAYVRELLPRRRRDAHKGDCGKVMAITGSAGMTGAGRLAGAAALRAGAGLVYLAVPAALAGIYEAAASETITLAAGGPGDASLTPEAAPSLISAAGRMDAVAIGPGLSTGEGALAAARMIIAGADRPLVIDADALTAVAADLSILASVRAGAVLTPHAGEMARLLGCPPESVQADRIGAARAFASKWGVTLVLKGFRTVVATPDGMARVNPTGNPGMATAGAGDVLAGMIAALIGGGMAIGDAAAAAAYLHGLAGDLAASELGEASVTASDIIACLPAAMAAVERGQAPSGQAPSGHAPRGARRRHGTRRECGRAVFEPPGDGLFDALHFLV
jgi:NAD(P)H-hydrate epimerase